MTRTTLSASPVDFRICTFINIHHSILTRIVIFIVHVFMVLRGEHGADLFVVQA